MRHSIYQNFHTNSLVLSNTVLFVSENCDLTNIPYCRIFQYFCKKIKESFKTLLNYNLQSQKALGLKKPVNLRENCDEKSVSFTFL